ncbi:MAG TPA: glycosyltransferase family 39 protein [Bacteroidales bacterium]|nr:glycosyltransferase family 39 protein [Bacteroidales bacterium]
MKLPFFWDEAWSYAVAVFDMNKHGLAFFPGQGNTELTRGHPLLFYFLSALWVKLFGESIFLIHLFSLLISCVLLVAVFFLVKKLDKKESALIIVTLLVLQPIFFVQSSLLLPEIMLTLWIILMLHSYVQKNWKLYILFSSLLVLTKETGIVAIASILIDRILLEYLFSKPTRSFELKKTLQQLVILIIPLGLFAVFMIIQRIRSGWFLFPEHTNFMVFDVSEIKNNLVLIKEIFFADGRKYLFVLSLMCISFLLGRKKLDVQTSRFIALCWLFILLYLLFCSMNFFASRYLLTAVVIFIIASILPIVKSLDNTLMKIGFTLLFGLIFMYYTFFKEPVAQDVSIGYKNNILLHQQAIHFAEDLNLSNQKIYSTFLMQYYMGIPELGYLKNKKPYILRNKSDIYDMYIFCSNEKDTLYNEIATNPEYKLLKRFANNKDWIEFYRKQIDPK